MQTPKVNSTIIYHNYHSAGKVRLRSLCSLTE